MDQPEVEVVLSPSGHFQCNAPGDRLVLSPVPGGGPARTRLKVPNLEVDGEDQALSKITHTSSVTYERIENKSRYGGDGESTGASRRSVGVLEEMRLRAVLQPHSIIHRIQFAPDRSQLRCLNAIALAISKPECLHLTCANPLFLG